MTVSPVEAILGFVLTFLLSGLTAYWVAYLRRRADNAAVHEDINKLTDQVKAVTRTTEEIKAEIGNEVWNRQRQWEIKRDILFDVMRALGRLNTALIDLHSFFEAVNQENQEDGNSEGWASEQSEALDKFQSASAAFDAATALVPLICGKELIFGFIKLSNHITNMSQNIVRRETASYQERAGDLYKQIVVLQVVIRKELGVPFFPDESETDWMQWVKT